MKTLNPYVARFFYLVFLALVLFNCSDDDENEIEPEEEVITPTPLPAPLFTFGTIYDSAAINYEVVGDPEINGTKFTFNAIDSVNNCGQPGGDYIKLDTLGPAWSNGFSVAAWVEFQENRYFERIIDFGNDRGEDDGMNITLSRLAESDDLVLTNWINSDSLINRDKGRLISRDAIVNGESVFYVGTIDPTGEMKIYINGELVASKTDGHPVMNVQRNSNYIGHSNWCDVDSDFKGVVNGVYLYDAAISAEEVTALYEYFTNSEN